jgi:DNA helicase HerA-like ATPase
MAQSDSFALWFSRKEAPAGMVLGVRKSFEGREHIIALSEEDRTRHTWSVGATGTGKTTLNANMALQDITQGRGCAIPDSLGPVLNQVLPRIPKFRVEDCVYLDPTDHQRPISINPFIAESDAEREWVTEALVLIFKRLFRVEEAPRLLHILRHAIRTLLESGGKTFLDIRTLLVNPRFRNQVLQDVRNPILLEFWEEEFPGYPKAAVDPVINKLTAFRLSSVIRNTLGQSDTTVDFSEIIRTRKVFLADLSEGKIGQENSMLLCSIIVSLIQLASMRSTAGPLYSIYIDEFPNVITTDSSTFQKMLSQARNFRLSLNLSNQHLSQIPRELRSAMLGNVHTLVAFRLGVEDARLLQAAFTDRSDKTAPKFIERLQNLSRGEALVRFETASNNFLMRTYPPAPIPSPNFAREVIEYSRTRYGRPIAHTFYSSHPVADTPSEAKPEDANYPPGTQPEAPQSPEAESTDEVDLWH